MLRNIILTISILLPFVASAESLSERKAINPVDLRSVSENPKNYEGLRIQFRSIFVAHGDLYDPFHTQFRKEQYMNIIAWDDQSALWSPEVRAMPTYSMYYEKRRNQKASITELKKFQLIDVVGEVVSSYDGQPWIDIHSITPVQNAGTYSDASVFLLQQANKLASEQVHDLAEQNYVAALKTNLNPDARVAVLEQQALNLLAWGKYEESIKVLDEALTLHKAWTGDALPTKLSELYYLSAKGYSEAAASAQAANDQSADEANVADYFQKSIDHAKLAVELEPEHGDAYAILGIGLSGLEEFDEARTHCQRAILMRPGNAEIRWYLGRILDRQGDYDEAIEVLNRAIDLSPKDYRIHKTIALVHLHKSDLGGKTAAEDRVTSLREFDIAIRLNSMDPDLFYFSGLVIDKAAAAGGKIRIGRAMVEATPKLAADRYEKCIALDDGYLPAVMALAKYYRGIEKHDQAVVQYKRGLELAPERDELYSKLAEYFISLDRLADAYDVHLKYHDERDAKHLDTLYQLGKLSLDLKEYKRSADWHETLVKLEQKHALAHADLSDSYVELGEWREVVEHADKALELLEDDAEKTRVYRKKGIALWAQDKPADALTALAGHTDGTKDIRVLLALGWSQTVAEKGAADALATAKAAVAMAGDNAEAKELLGWSYYLNGDFKAAESTLSKLELAKELSAYRVGMSVFKQGSARYPEAKKLFDVARNLRDNRSILKSARGDISSAQRAIRDHERAVERQAAADKRAADKKAREEAKKKKEEARRKAEADKKAKEMAERKARDEARRKAAEEKKRKEMERKKAAEEKKRKELAAKKAAEEKKRRDAAAKKAAAEAAKKKK